MTEKRRLRNGILVRVRGGAEAEPEPQVYLLAETTLAFVDSIGTVTFKTRPPDEMLVPVLSIMDVEGFIEGVLSWNFIPTDSHIREKIGNGIERSLRLIRDSYFEPTLAEKLYTAANNSGPAWNDLDELARTGWNQAAYFKQQYDEACEKMGKQLFPVEVPVKHPPEWVRPIKDVPQA